MNTPNPIKHGPYGDGDSSPALGPCFLIVHVQIKGYLSHSDLFSFLFIIRPLERNLSLITHLRDFPCGCGATYWSICMCMNEIFTRMNQCVVSKVLCAISITLVTGTLHRLFRSQPWRVTKQEASTKCPCDSSIWSPYCSLLISVNTGG